jgi:hypothetical protein
MANESKGDRVSSKGGLKGLFLFVLIWSVGTMGFDAAVARGMRQQIWVLGYRTIQEVLGRDDLEAF